VCITSDTLCILCLCGDSLNYGWRCFPPPRTPSSKTPWLLTPSCRLHWFSFTDIKTLAWILLTGQVFTANKNLRLQKHKKRWNCREMMPCWGCLPVAQGIILRKAFELWLRRRIQIIYEKSGFDQTISSFLSYPSFFRWSREDFQESRCAVPAWPTVGRVAEISVQGLVGLVVWNDPDHVPEPLVEKYSSMPGTRDWSNQCFLDKVGGKACEECSISISYCWEPCVCRQPSGCEVFLMQILFSCFSCSPLLFQPKEKRVFKFGCFKEDWLTSAAVWLNWIHMLGEGAGLVRSPN